MVESTSVDVREQLEGILSRHRRDRGELIPILQEVQKQFSYLPEEAMNGVARFLRIPESNVYGVATFYAQFKFTPMGRQTVKVCRGTACHVRGGAKILEEIQKRLGIAPGGTTEDLEYSLETIACFGSCALAPVVVVEENVHGRMTPAKAGQILS